MNPQEKQELFDEFISELHSKGFIIAEAKAPNPRDVLKDARAYFNQRNKNYTKMARTINPDNVNYGVYLNWDHILKIVPRIYGGRNLSDIPVNEIPDANQIAIAISDIIFDELEIRCKKGVING